MLRSRPPVWVLWIPLVWLVSSPWIGFTTQAQWHRIHWLPFTDPADRIRDFAANILLFVPFGLSAGWRRAPAHAILRAAGLAAIVSFSAESMQLFSTRRYPSATDIVAAIIGSSSGAITTLLLRRPSKDGKWTD